MYCTLYADRDFLLDSDGTDGVVACLASPSRLIFSSPPIASPVLLRVKDTALLMAASNSRDPHNIPLPPSPAAPIKPTKQSSRKGKGKEDAGSSKRRVGQQSTKGGTREGEGAESPWDWVSLTDSVASSSPPIFTKDGRCACRASSALALSVQ